MVNKNIDIAYMVYLLLLLSIASSIFYVYMRKRVLAAVRALGENGEAPSNTEMFIFQTKRRSFDIAWCCIMSVALMMIMVLGQYM